METSSIVEAPGKMPSQHGRGHLALVSHARVYALSSEVVIGVVGWLDPAA
jgi:hypothetical protein